MSQLSAASVAKAAPGGQAVSLLQRKCGCGSPAGLSGECEECGKKKMLGIQTKLAISEPGDQHEQEADRIAEEVTRTQAPYLDLHAGHHEPKTLRAQPRQPMSVRITPLVLRRSENEEQDDEERALLARDPVASPVSAGTDACIRHARQSGGQPLDPVTRATMESSFGIDFSKVRIHTDSRAAAAARAINARAFTIGQDVAFGAGQFAPQSQVGRRLLAHELVHVAQQGAGPPSVVHRKKDEGDNVPERILRIVIRKDSKRIVFVGEQSEESISLKGDADIFPEGQFIGESTANGFRFTLPDGKRRTVTLKSKGASKALRQAIRSSKSFPVEVTDAAGNRPAGGGGEGGSSPPPGGAPGATDVEPVPSGTDEGVGPATQAGEGGEPPAPVEQAEDEPDDERDTGDEAGMAASDAREFGVLITAPGGELQGDLTKAGQIEDFSDKSRAQIRQRAQKAAVSTLVSCFGIEPSAAEALASTRKIRIRLPRLGRLRKMAADSDASRELPIAADLGALEGLLVDELGLSEGSTCERQESECFFDDSLCLPRLNIEVGSIEQKRDVETLIGAAEAAVDAVEILMTLGALEAAEEGAEFLLKQYLRKQRRKGAAERKVLREAEKITKQMLREKEQIRKSLASRSDTVRRSSVEGYDAEIKVGTHTYRRLPDGTWCRTTQKICKITFDPKLEKEIEKQLEVLEEFGEHPDVPSAAGSELPRRAKPGKGEPPGKVEGEAAEASHALEVVGGHPLDYRHLPRAEKQRWKEILWGRDRDALKKFARELPATGASQVPLPTRFGKRIADHIFMDGETVVVVLRESKKYRLFKLNAKLRRQLDADIDAASRFNDVRVEWRISGKIDASTLEELKLLAQENPGIFRFVPD